MAYILDGVIAVRLLTTLPATPTAPTQAELTAGVNLVGSKQLEELIAISGWQKTTSEIATPGYAGPETGVLAGESNYAQSSMTWRAHLTDETIWSAVAETTTLQWVFICQQGLSSGNRGLLYPVTIAVREEGVERNVAHSFRADFSVTPPYVCTQAA